MSLLGYMTDPEFRKFWQLLRGTASGTTSHWAGGRPIPAPLRVFHSCIPFVYSIRVFHS
jgi:hypothetical protein